MLEGKTMLTPPPKLEEGQRLIEIGKGKEGVLPHE